MSRIDDLIAEFAPLGVHHVVLSEVAGYSDTRVDAADLDEMSFIGVDNLLPNKGGKTEASYLPNTARLTAYSPGDVLLGNIRPYLKKVWLADGKGGCSGDVLAVRINDEYALTLDAKFLYYLLSSDGFFAYDMQHAKGAKMPRGNKVAILNYRIPVPPLEVQREIVRILDQFTQLEAELEAELEARRLQYEHYRSSLLGFDADTPVVPLGELASIGTGSRNTNEAVPGGEFPFFVRSQEPLAIDAYEFDEQAVITAGDGVGVGKVFHYVDGKYGLHQRAYRVVSTSERLVPRFLFHVFRAHFARYLEMTSVHASVTSLRKPMFEKYPIPVPSVEEQLQIVDLLDKFDALVNDLSVGLPAELAARRKQYEYYRDRLLTFEEVVA
jgi:type I restriction enzyme S subunit